MRVFLVTSIERGGPLEHALLLAKGLAARGVDVAAVSATEAAAGRFAEAGAEPHTLPLRRPFDPVQARRLGRLTAPADVVHAHDRRSGLWTRLPRRPDARSARVYTAHGLPDAYLPPHPGRRRTTLRTRLAYRGLDAALARRTDAVIAPSQAAADLLVERLGYPADRLTVIRNGVEPRRGGSDGRGELIGTLSVLEPVKALDVFLRSAARVAHGHPAARFAIFGTGSERERLKGLAHSLGIADRLEMPGHVPAPEALAQLGIFVICSHMETSGMALLEAMAAGVPAVATRVGGVPESAPPGTAQLEPAGDEQALAGAIERLLADPALAESQARAARRHVEEHAGAEAMAGAVHAVYERVLAARRR